MHITPTRRPHCQSSLPRVNTYYIFNKRSDDKEWPPLQIHYTSFRCCFLLTHSDTLSHLTGNRYTNNCDVILYVRSLFSFPFHTHYHSIHKYSIRSILFIGSSSSSLRADCCGRPHHQPLLGDDDGAWEAPSTADVYSWYRSIYQ